MDSGVRLLLDTEKEGDFGVTFVQRKFGLRYSVAERIIQAGISAGYLVEGEKPWTVIIIKGK